MPRAVDVLYGVLLLGVGVLLVAVLPAMLESVGLLPAVTLALLGAGIAGLGCGLLFTGRRRAIAAGLGLAVVAIGCVAIGVAGLLAPDVLVGDPDVAARSSRYPVPDDPGQARVLAGALLVVAMGTGAIGWGLLRDRNE
jgi:hypothetical protein